jgi:hypothetical protein
VPRAELAAPSSAMAEGAFPPFRHYMLAQILVP